MNSTGYATFVGVCGTILGYLVSLWRSRIIPWVTLVECSTVKREADRVKVSDKLRNASVESWFMEELHSAETELQNVHDCYQSARVWLILNKDSEATLKSAKEKLDGSPANEDIQEALQAVLGLRGLSHVLQMALKRQKIHCAPDLSLTVQLPLHIVDEDDGRFQFELPESILHFGRNVNKTPYIKTRLEPFAQMAARLEAAKLRQVFTELEPLLKTQRDIHQTIADEAQMIVDQQRRWLLKLSVSNLGSGPVAVFPSPCTLRVTGHHIKPFDLECHLLRPEEGKWSPLEAVSVIEAGKVVEFAAVTDKTQGNIDGGELLKDVYKTGKAVARLRLQCMGRDIPWKQTITSTKAAFKGND